MNIKIHNLITIEQKSWQKKSLLMKANSHRPTGGGPAIKKQNKTPQKRSVSASPLFLLITIFIAEESQNHIQHKQTGRNTPC